MTLYEIKKLTPSELLRLKALLQLYEGYDKLDMLIEQVITPDYFTRKEIQEMKEEVLRSDSIPEELKFCDGGKCEIGLVETKTH